MRQKLGQHFLKDTSAIKTVVDAFSFGSAPTVIEIGPGRGALTEPLLEKISALGGRLIAVEKDTSLAKDLRERKLIGLEIVEGDILEELPKITKGLTGKYFLTGNIPYYLTGFLLRTISELTHKPELTVFTIQKEVAERLAAEPPKMNKLAASVRFWAEPKILKMIPRGSFSPPPEVDSAIISLKPKGGELAEDQASYYIAVNALFAQPRKTVLNNLSAKLDLPRKEAVQKASRILMDCGINPDSRPQDLSVENIEAIAKTSF